METKKARRRRREYSKEFKQEAVRLILEQGMSCRQVGQDLGVHSTLIARWVKEQRDRQEEAFPGKGKRGTSEEAFRKLEEELRRTRMERDILKKPWRTSPKSRSEVRLHRRPPPGVSPRTDVSVVRREQKRIFRLDKARLFAKRSE